MAGPQHGVGLDVLVDVLLLGSLEVMVQEEVVLLPNDRWHQDVHLVTMNLEHVVAKQNGDTVVCLHYFGGGVLVA